MPEKTKATTKAPQDTRQEQFERMAAFNGEAMEIFAQACQAYANGMATLNGELMNFVNTRLNHDVKLSRALAECGNWSDAANLQRDWAQQATREYLSEASRITELATKIAKESWEPVYERANQIMTELNKPVQ